jgi:hypothetical protein
MGHMTSLHANYGRYPGATYATAEFWLLADELAVPPCRGRHHEIYSRGDAAA